MKIISWNINGIRAAMRKGFDKFLKSQDPDIICLQEIKSTKDQLGIDFQGYYEYWNPAQRKGYSGTAIFSKKKPIKVINDIVIEGVKVDNLADKFGDPNDEGRVLTLEFDNFFVSTVYTPNSKSSLERLDLRHKLWDPAFLMMMKELEKSKSVIFTGDLNVAHNEIDLARPDDNHKTHGFTLEERLGFDNIVKSGFIDTFRYLHPDQSEIYSWWSPFGKSRERNVGWRIDYICVSDHLKSQVTSASVLMDQAGSDHAPVVAEIEV